MGGEEIFAVVPAMQITGLKKTWKRDSFFKTTKTSPDMTKMSRRKNVTFCFQEIRKTGLLEFFILPFYTIRCYIACIKNAH